MIKKYLSVVLALLLAVVAPTATFAGTVSNTVTVPLSLNIGESVSLSVSSNSINLSNAQQSQSITLTLAWQLASGHTSANVVSWFSALPNSGSAPIPPQDFTTQYNAGTAVTCNQTGFNLGSVNGVPGQNCGEYSLPSSALTTDLADSSTVNFTLAANPAVFVGQGGTVGVGTYTGGILNLEFVVI